MPYDNLCKYLAEQYPHHFASWLLGEGISEATRIEVLKTELSNEPIRADALLLLRQQSILHIEFQTTPLSRPPLPLRMLDYWVRIHREYDLPITQFAVFLRATNEAIVDEFRAQNTWHRYHVMKLWEQDKQAFLANVGLLPLAPLTRTESPEELLARGATREAVLEAYPALEPADIDACLLYGARLAERTDADGLSVAAE